MKKLLKAGNVRFISMLLAILLALPFTWKSLTGIYLWLSPFIMLNSVFVLKSMVWLNSLAFLILVISWFRKRWFCSYLCPVGWGCDKIAKYHFRKKFSLARIPDIGLWLALTSLTAALAGVPVFVLLDPLAIFNGFFSIFTPELSLTLLLSFSVLPLILVSNLVFPGLWCKRVCPLGGLQSGISTVKARINNLTTERKIPGPINKNGTSRRFFILSGIGVISGLFLKKTLRAGEQVSFRPPGSVPGELFNVLCVRCGSCIKSCPTKIISRHTGLTNPAAWMTPEINFEKGGYCLEDCNLCSQVCSTGAINLFDISAKSRLKIGTALVHPENCLLTEFTECDRCKSACSYEAIDFVPYRAEGHMIPVVNKNKCTGCGACSAICPPLTIEMLPLS